MTLEITSARNENGVGVIRFKDGHVATFYMNTGGWGGGPHMIGRLLLKHNHDEVALYYSPYQFPVNHTPFGIRRLAPGYTVAKATLYWKAAYDYVAAAAKQRKLTSLWYDIVAHGHKDITDLQAGRWSAP
jgi:hypothetical protein